MQLVSSCARLPPLKVDQVNSAAADGTKQSLAPENDPASSGFFNGTPEGEKQAWLSFIKDGRYRIARPEEFKFSGAARKLQPTDLERARQQPYVGGDINRDGQHYDFAAIVVNTERKDPARFSIVVFTQPSDPQKPYRTDLLFGDRDLSQTILEWWSGGLAIRTYHADGTYDYCIVNFDHKSKSYSCDDEVIPSAGR